jgi:hypothetical protein
VSLSAFTCSGSSDDGRERTITTPISPGYVKEILRLQEAGATEEDLYPIVADAITPDSCHIGRLVVTYEVAVGRML